MIRWLSIDLSRAGVVEYLLTKCTADILICLCSALAVRCRCSTAVWGQTYWHSVSNKTGNEVTEIGILSGMKQELKSDEAMWRDGWCSMNHWMFSAALIGHMISCTISGRLRVLQLHAGFAVVWCYCSVTLSFSCQSLLSQQISNLFLICYIKQNTV